VLVTSIQALKSRGVRCRHAYATEMRPKSLSGDSVEGLFKTNESSASLLKDKIMKKEKFVLVLT